MNNYDYFNVLSDTVIGPLMPNDNNSTNLNTNNMQINMQNMQGNMQNNALFGPYEGFIRGNLFRNAYEPYKNYQPDRLTPRSEQEEALLNLNQMQFAMHELNLYLDNFPNDRDMMNQFVMFRNTYNRLLADYENRYGAITINSPSLNNVPFGWVEQNWPWDRRNM